MKTRPKKVTKVIAKLELHPINSESGRSLGSAFSDASKLVEICYRYFRGVLPARLVKEYPGLEKGDVALLRLTAKRAGVRLPSDTVLETIKRVYTNFRTSGETFGTRPRSIRPFIPIRVTKVTPEGKRYRRNLSIEEVKSADARKVLIAATVRLGDRDHKRRAACYITGEADREPFCSVCRAMRGEGMWLGDPSVLVERGGRYFLHLSATRDPEPFGDASRVLGIDLGISGPVAAMFAVEFAGYEWKPLDSELFSSGEFRGMWFGLMRGRQRTMSLGMKEAGGAVRGQRFAELTALGASKQTERTSQFVYFLVNRAVEIAKRNGCGVIAIENLRSFRGVIRGLRRRRKTLGVMYNRYCKKGEFHTAREVLREISGIKTRIKLLQALPWGKFERDMANEALWHGIRLVKVWAPGTSITCPRCTHRSPENRPTRGQFRCTSCGFSMQADWLAALNVTLKSRKLIEKCVNVNPLGHKRRGGQRGIVTAPRPQMSDGA